MDVLFKILTPEEWEAFKADGSFTGSSLNQKDGFIHASFHNQFPNILQKYFKDCRPLVLAKIDAQLLEHGTLRIEANKPGGEKYPHIYGELPFKAVISYEILEE